MDSLEKESLDFSIVRGGETGYAIRLTGSVFNGIEYKYTTLKVEDKPSGMQLYYDFEITKNPTELPLTDELRNFIGFVTERLVRSRLVKVVNEEDRDDSAGESALQ